MGLGLCLDWKSGESVTLCNGHGEAQSHPDATYASRMFSHCGKLVEHHHICGWLCIWQLGSPSGRQAESQRDGITKLVTSNLKQMMNETGQIMTKGPCLRNCCENRSEINKWVDASSLMTGVLLKKDGATLKDAC